MALTVEQECLWSEEVRRIEEFIDILDRLLQRTEVVSLGTSGVDIKKILSEAANHLDS